MLTSEGLTLYAIGKRLKRASNTIRNEIELGTVTQIKNVKLIQCYFADAGQRTYEENRKNCGARMKALQCTAFFDCVHECFYEKNHSLDAIDGNAIYMLKWCFQ